MHVKDFLAGKRGKCPHCGGSIRIPGNGEEYSLPVSSEERSTTNDKTSADIPERSSRASAEASETSAPVPVKISAVVSSVDTSSVTSTSEASPSSVASTMPSVIAEALNAAWYVRPQSGGQYGPAVGAVFWEWLKEKRVGESALVWREGWGNWQSASEVFSDFFASLGVNSGTIAKAPPPAAPPVKPPKTMAPISGGKQETKKLETIPSDKQSASAVIATSMVDSTVEGRRNLTMRRKRSNQQNLLLMAGLLLVAVVLIGTLVAVLWLQSNG